MHPRAGGPLRRWSPVSLFRSLLVVLSVAACAACGGPRLGLDPAAVVTASEMARVGWGILPLLVGLLAAVSGAWAYARGRQAHPLPSDEERRLAQRLFILGCLLLPTLNIAILLLFGVPTAQRLLVLSGKNALRIELVAYPGGWQVRYPPADLVLEDELLLPRGRTVDLQVQSAEGRHSVGLPQLGRKIEAVPGKTTTLRFRAERVGVFGGPGADPRGERDGGSAPAGSAPAGGGLRVVVLEPEVFAARLAGRGK